MLYILSGLLPIFLLICVGVLLKRLEFVPRDFWPGLERLGFYVLFPCLLLVTLSKADFSRIETGTFSAAMLVCMVVNMGMVLFARPLLRRWHIKRPQFSTIFQTATRWNAFTALIIADKALGPDALALTAFMMLLLILPLNIINLGVVIYYGDGEASWSQVFKRMLQNPLIIAASIGLLMQVLGIRFYEPLLTTFDLLGRGALSLGLLMVGAGLRLRDTMAPNLASIIATTSKLLIHPLLFIIIAKLFGIAGDMLVVGAVCAAVPTAMNGYLIAREYGGDAPLYAATATIQTVASFLTLPLIIVLSQAVA